MNRSAATGEFSVPNSDFDRTYDLAASLIQGKHTISISFLNDWGDADGDRNARIDRIEVIAPDGSRSVFEGEALPAGSTVEGCGHQTADYYQLSCSGSIQIPWSVTVTGDYLIKVVRRWRAIWPGSGQNWLGADRRASQHAKMKRSSNSCKRCTNNCSVKRWPWMTQNWRTPTS